MTNDINQGLLNSIDCRTHATVKVFAEMHGSILKERY